MIVKYTSPLPDLVLYTGNSKYRTYLKMPDPDPQLRPELDLDLKKKYIYMYTVYIWIHNTAPWHHSMLFRYLYQIVENQVFRLFSFTSNSKTLQWMLVRVPDL
jgi:hypothetical protein